MAVRTLAVTIGLWTVFLPGVPDPEWFERMQKGVPLPAQGGDRSRHWVPRNPVAALEFVLAGAIAERGAFGHCLEGAYTGDLTVWRVGASLTDAQTQHSLDLVLGQPFSSVVNEVENWARDHWLKIKIVAAALAGVDDVTESQRLEFRDGWRLSEAQVLKLTN